ncbi:MAK10-like protein [Tanacetum coccineum]
MGDENPIRTLEDYSRPSHEGYRNTIKLPEGNNVASNWLERLPAGSISTWEDLTTRFLVQFFPPGRTAKPRNDILIQSSIEGLVSEFMASQDARLSRFEAGFKQQQYKMTNKIDTVLKAVTNQIAGTLPSDTVKNPKLGTHPVLSARSYPISNPQYSSHLSTSINAIKAHLNDTIIMS